MVQKLKQDEIIVYSRYHSCTQEIRRQCNPQSNSKPEMERRPKHFGTYRHTGKCNNVTTPCWYAMQNKENPGRMGAQAMHDRGCRGVSSYRPGCCRHTLRALRWGYRQLLFGGLCRCRCHRRCRCGCRSRSSRRWHRWRGHGC